MRHLGDITKLRGYAVPVVDCITGGSPCQDLSVAGKRAGLQGERSGLFMEQIRIIKEMRARDRLLGRTGADVRPRYMVWENVPGAFSSNKGKDFAAVLEETIRVVCPEAPALSVPRSGGGWPNAGCIYDILGRWSVAWRVHDAQFWGVPQRRKRIALVADFGGSTAPEILFERESVPRDFESRRTPGQGAAAGIESGLDSAICIQGNCIDRADTAGCNGRGWRRGASYTLNTIDRPAVFAPETARALTARNDGSPCVDRGPEVIVQAFHLTQTPVTCEDISPCLSSGNPVTGQACIGVAAFSGGQGAKANGIGYQEECAPSLKSVMSGGNTVPTIVSFPKSDPMVFENHGQDTRYKGPVDVSQTVSAKFGTGGGNTPFVVERDVHCFQNTGRGWWNEGEIGATIRTPCGGDSTKANLIAAVDCRNGTENPSINGTLQAKSTGGIGVNFNNVVRENKTVRRLTPLECERLQGYPDNWTRIGELIGFTVWTDENGNEYPDAIYKYVGADGKMHKTSDSARYKALGNSIALPFWDWLLARITAHYDRPATLGSLFDGIGGFPLCWERHNGAGTAIWASEIEEFCIAVTQRRFSEV